MAVHTLSNGCGGDEGAAKREGMLLPKGSCERLALGHCQFPSILVSPMDHTEALNDCASIFAVISSRRTVHSCLPEAGGRALRLRRSGKAGECQGISLGYSRLVVG